MKVLFAIAILLTAVIAPAAAQPPHDHVAMTRQTEASRPRDMGQSAFAAIQEIVGMLQADPSTDWSRVNIDALRQHLIDMDNVVLHANVSTTATGKVVTFDLSGSEAVRDSMQRMIFAQAARAERDAGWTYSARETPLGAALVVVTPDEASAIKLRSLGYFGLVSQGTHHQMHHMMIARGLPLH